MKFFRKVDQAILWLVGAVVWWVDVHYDRNNIFQAKVFGYLITPLATFFALWIIFVREASVEPLPLILITGMQAASAISMLVAFIARVFVIDNPYTDMVRHAKMTPNPNNGRKEVVELKALLWVGIIVISSALLRHAMDRMHLWLFITVPFIVMTTVYILCVENIPPEEKRRRKAEKEMKGMAHRGVP